MWAIFSTSYTCTFGSNSNSLHIADDLSAAFFLKSISAFRGEIDAAGDENWVVASLLPHRTLNSFTSRCRDRARWLPFREHKRNHLNWPTITRKQKQKAYLSKMISDGLYYFSPQNFNFINKQITLSKIAIKKFLVLKMVSHPCFLLRILRKWDKLTITT